MTRRELTMAQGSAEWHKARLGIPTASHFADIVTPAGKPTKNAARTTYLCQLVAERLANRPTPHFVTTAMQRGTECEPLARAWYELTTGRTVRQIGIATLDGVREDGTAWTCGASPDGLHDAGGVEIKCPLTHNLIAQIVSADPVADYYMQAQGCMWVCGRDAWDVVLYSQEPGVPSTVWPLKADATLHAAFAALIPAFCAEVDAAEARVIELGGCRVDAQWAAQEAALMGGD